MVSIERLQSKFKKPFLTLCDLLNKDNTVGNNFMWLYPATHLFKPYVEKKLENVTVGKYFGWQGISIDELLAKEHDYVIELTYHELLDMPVHQQTRLLTEYTVIISELEEGGAGFGKFNKCIIKHIVGLGIVPKKIFCLTSGYDQKNLPELNITSVYIPVWLILAVTCDSFYTDIIFNQSNKDAALLSILNTNKTFGICLNKKPRYHRVKLLAELHKRQLLDSMDWSLIYHTESPGGRPGEFINNPNNFRFSRIVKQSEDEDITSFLNAYNFPKYMTDYKHATMGDSIGPSPTWLGKYKYYVGNETYSEIEHISLGTTKFLTEKTFKPMCMGAYPFINGIPGVEKHAVELGFKIHDHGYDHLAGTERILAICNILNQAYHEDRNVQEAVQHNFLHITNIDFLTDILAKPAMYIAKHSI